MSSSSSESEIPNAEQKSRKRVRKEKKKRLRKTSEGPRRKLRRATDEEASTSSASTSRPYVETAAAVESGGHSCEAEIVEVCGQSIDETSAGSAVNSTSARSANEISSASSEMPGSAGIIGGRGGELCGQSNGTSAEGVESSNSRENEIPLATSEMPGSAGGGSSGQGTSSRQPATRNQSSNGNEGNGSNQTEGATARERFNNRNQQVTPLRKCSELIPGRRYQVLNLSRTNTQYGPAIRATIVDDRSPTGRSFVYLPVRFRSMSDDDLLELNNQASSPDRLYIVYNGKVGRADMVELV